MASGAAAQPHVSSAGQRESSKTRKSSGIGSPQTQLRQSARPTHAAAEPIRAHVGIRAQRQHAAKLSHINISPSFNSHIALADAALSRIVLALPAQVALPSRHSTAVALRRHCRHAAVSPPLCSLRASRRRCPRRAGDRSGSVSAPLRPSPRCRSGGREWPSRRPLSRSARWPEKEPPGPSVRKVVSRLKFREQNYFERWNKMTQTLPNFRACQRKR